MGGITGQEPNDFEWERNPPRQKQPVRTVAAEVRTVGWAIQGRAALLTAKAGDSLTPAMRRQIKQELSVRRKLIAERADQDLRDDIAATRSYLRQLQAALDAKGITAAG